MNKDVLAVSISQAAGLLGVCPRTIANLIQSKELISRRIGRRRVIQVSVLEAFLRRDHKVPKKRKRVGPIEPSTTDAKADAKGEAE